MLAALVLGSLTIQWFLLPHEFRGPDARTFIRIAEQEAIPGFWSDPEAFSGNYWSIGYPTFLAVLRRFFGPDLGAIQFVQAVLSSSLVALTWWICRAETAAVRLTAAACVAVSPSVIFMGWNGGYEVLLSWLMVVSIAVAWGLGGRPAGWRWWRRWGVGVTAGISLGLAFMVQNKAIVIAPVCLYLLWKWGRPVVAAFLMGVLAPIAMWSLRNVLVRSSPSPFNTNGPINMWIGSNPEATTGGFMEPPPLPSGSSTYLDATLRFWVSQPEASVSLLLRRVARLLEPVFIYPEVALPTGGTLVLHAATALLGILSLLLFAAYAFGRLWARPPVLPAVGPLALAWLAFLIVHLPFLAESRFRTPMEPLLFAVSVPTAFSLAAKWRARRGSAWPRPPASSAGSEAEIV